MVNPPAAQMHPGVVIASRTGNSWFADFAVCELVIEHLEKAERGAGLDEMFLLPVHHAET